MSEAGSTPEPSVDDVRVESGSSAAADGAVLPGAHARLVAEHEKSSNMVHELRETLSRADNSLNNVELYLHSVHNPHVLWNAISAEYTNHGSDSDAQLARELEKALAKSEHLLGNLTAHDLQNPEQLLQRLDALIERCKP